MGSEATGIGDSPKKAIACAVRYHFHHKPDNKPIDLELVELMCLKRLHPKRK